MSALPPELLPDDSIRSPKLRELINAIRAAVEAGYIGGPGIDIVGNTITAWDVAGATQRVEWDALVESYVPEAGGVIQWTYQVREVSLTTAGYGGWTWTVDGRSGTAYNRWEEGNTASGLQMSGVDTGNLIGTFAHQPVPVGALVRIEEYVLPSGDVCLWFFRPALIDGACP